MWVEWLERVRLGGLKKSIRGSLLPLILALQCFLGSLQLLDAFGVVYFPMVYRATRAVRFELGVSLVLPLVLLLVFWLGWVVWIRRFEALLFPAVAVLVYPFLGLEASISVASLLAMVSGFFLSFEPAFYKTWT